MLALKSQCRQPFRAYAKTLTSTFPRSPTAAVMADDQKEARAVKLASQALELVAAGEDEVCIYR